MEKMLLVSFTKSKTASQPQFMKLKQTHQKQFVLQNHYSDPTAVFSLEKLNSRSLDKSQIPWGLSKHDYKIDNDPAALACLENLGYGFRGKMTRLDELDEDGKEKIKAEVTVTDYFGRTDILTINDFTDLQLTSIRNRSIFEGEYKQTKTREFSIQVNVYGTVMKTDSGLNIDYPIDIQGEAKKYSPEDKHALSAIEGGLVCYSWRDLLSDNQWAYFNDHEFKELLQFDIVWLIKALSEMKAKHDRDNHAIIQDVRFVLHRLIRFLKPVIFFRIDSVVSADFPVKHKEAAIAIKQKFALLTTLSSAETLDFDRIMEVLRTDWSKIQSKIWLANADRVRPILEHKMDTEFDEEMKVTYPKNLTEAGPAREFRNLLVQYLETEKQYSEKWWSKKVGKYMVWYQDPQVCFIDTHNKTGKQYSLSLCSETRRFK
jgi:hypothetical protein